MSLNEVFTQIHSFAPSYGTTGQNHNTCFRDIIVMVKVISKKNHAREFCGWQKEWETSQRYFIDSANCWVTLFPSQYVILQTKQSEILIFSRGFSLFSLSGVAHDHELSASTHRNTLDYRCKNCAVSAFSAYLLLFNMFMMTTPASTSAVAAAVKATALKLLIAITTQIAVEYLMRCGNMHVNVKNHFL